MADRIDDKQSTPTISTANLTGWIESRVRFSDDRCQFTLKNEQDHLFFVQAYEEKIELCRTLRRGDVVTVVTVPRSFKHNQCKKHHIYFELVCLVE